LFGRQLAILWSLHEITAAITTKEQRRICLDLQTDPFAEEGVKGIVRFLQEPHPIPITKKNPKTVGGWED
jgi:hypothetical protein